MRLEYTRLCDEAEVEAGTSSTSWHDREVDDQPREDDEADGEHGGPWYGIYARCCHQITFEADFMFAPSRVA